MDLIKDELLAALADIEPRPAQLPLYITGRLSDTCALGTELDAAYWWDNVRLSVRFKHAIDCLAKDHYSLFLEIGPHPVLSNSILECFSARQLSAKAVPSIRRAENEGARFKQSLATLHGLGLAINWAPMYQGGSITTLPTYPWKTIVTGWRRKPLSRCA